jgi:DNA-binding IclR family transcriptional regulator
MTALPHKNHEKYTVVGLERGLKLLALFSGEQPEQTLSELARRLGLSRSSVFRVVYTLESMGFLQRQDNRYRLGPRVLTLGFDYLASQDLVEIARPQLAALRDATGVTAHLGILDRTDVIYVAQAASLRPFASRISVGSRLPAHAMSMGRLLLGGLGDEELTALYAGRALERFTEDTPTTLPTLRERIAIDRERGYVVSRGSFERGIAAVAAPVRDGEGRVVAAINIAGPAAVLDNGALDGVFKDRVIEAAQEISRLLGYRPKQWRSAS